MGASGGTALIAIVPGPRGRLRVDDGGESAGAAPPLIAVHGLAGSIAHMAPLLEVLRRTRRAVALDLPAHGASEAPRDDDLTVEANAEAVLAVADQLGLGRFALAGHSYGGSVVAHLAARCPERVTALAFLDCGRWQPTLEELGKIRHGFRPERYARFVEEKWFGPILVGAREATRHAVLASLRATPRAVFMAIIHGMLGYDLRTSAERYPGPKLALCADAFGMASRWEGSTVGTEALPGVSHWLQLDAPEPVAGALERWTAAAAR
ncbi:MAG TPA: alpha/beta fold hydrolase [Anaeromyxobacteraceae bacterium]|nr:alpha/beta fold hydrolase [Anaeromyxobacteraceae bacterium]